MAWIHDKKEVEVVDLVLRLREKLVNFVSFFGLIGGLAGDEDIALTIRRLQV